MIERKGRGTYFHSAVAHGNTLYLSGCVAEDRSAPMKEQTRQALDKIGRVLAEHGTDASKILSATVYITDFAAKGAMNEAWVEWCPAADLPARATIGVATLGEGVLIEIMVIAAR